MSEFVFDLQDPARRRDPFALYARARREHPVYLHPGLPVASVFGYRDVLGVLRDAETYSNVRKGRIDLEERPDMLGSDAPEHTRLRGLVNKAFTPRIVAQLSDGLVKVADQLLDRALEKGEVDLVDALSYPLPVIAISDILGIPSEDRELFRAWSDLLVSTTALDFGQTVDPGHIEERRRVGREMDEYFSRMAEARRREPRDDLITGLVGAELEGTSLDFGEMLAMINLLLVAGNETTTNLIGSAIAQLDARPEVAASLREDPRRIPRAVEEVLRFESPVQVDPKRVARAVAIRGVEIPEDYTVLGWIGSANRDESAFERPTEFDIDREPNRHISFGFGQHYCLGANLARLEARVALRALLERTSEFVLTNTEPLPIHPSFIFRGPRRRPAQLRAA